MKKIALLVITPLLLLSIVFTAPVYALDGKAETGFKDGVNQSGGKGQNNLMGTVQNIINTLLFVAGMVAVVVIVISGFRFITAEGDSNSTNRAKNSIIYASIGLIVAVSAYAIVNFILEQI